MGILSTLSILLGTIVTLIGFWFIAKSDGQNTCKDKPESAGANYVGGIVGVVIGILIIVISLFLRTSVGQSVAEKLATRASSITAPSNTTPFVATDTPITPTASTTTF